MEKTNQRLHTYLTLETLNQKLDSYLELLQHNTAYFYLFQENNELTKEIYNKLKTSYDFCEFIDKTTLKTKMLHIRDLIVRDKTKSSNSACIIYNLNDFENNEESTIFLNNNFRDIFTTIFINDFKVHIYFIASENHKKTLTENYFYFWDLRSASFYDLDEQYKQQKIKDLLESNLPKIENKNFNKAKF